MHTYKWGRKRESESERNRATHSRTRTHSNSIIPFSCYFSIIIRLRCGKIMFDDPIFRCRRYFVQRCDFSVEVETNYIIIMWHMDTHSVLRRYALYHHSTHFHFKFLFFIRSCCLVAIGYVAGYYRFIYLFIFICSMLIHLFLLYFTEFYLDFKKHSFFSISE